MCVCKYERRTFFFAIEHTFTCIYIYILIARDQTRIRIYVFAIVIMATTFAVGLKRYFIYARVYIYLIHNHIYIYKRLPPRSYKGSKKM